MTAYELGVLSAQQRNIPGHLKQAYALGFAGAFEKRAERPNGFIAGPLVGGALGGTAGLAVSPLAAIARAKQKHDAEEDQRKKRRAAIVGALQGLVGAPLVGAGLGTAAGLGVGGIAEILARSVFPLRRWT